MPETDARQLRLTRRILADPTGAALLLSGPAPGLVPEGLRSASPRRTAVAYVVDVLDTPRPGRPVAGKLVLGYGPGPGGRPSTVAALTLQLPPGACVPALRERAEEFLARLARAAEERSRAA